MASFVPNHRKKIDHLERTEEAFRRLAEGEANHEELLKAALDVRDARIRALRAKQNQLKPTEEIAFQRLKDQTATLRSKSAEAMLAELLET